MPVSARPPSVRHLREWCILAKALALRVPNSTNQLRAEPSQVQVHVPRSDAAVNAQAE